MMNSGSSSSRDAPALAITPRVAKKPRMAVSDVRDLVAQGRQTKTSLAETLKLLKSQGKLTEEVTKRQITEACSFHSKQETPYGPVVQRLELGLSGLKYLNVVNPFAYLYYLSTISQSFSELMHDCCKGGHPLRLIIYADEMNPGNPFRPEKSRTLQCVYWAFADWPSHVLSRTFSWLVLFTMRSTMVEKIPGGMSYMCRLMLRCFFQEQGHSMDRGIMLTFNNESFLVTAVFAGFLCDLKGHKENTEWKGTGANVCCLSCANVDKRLLGSHDANVVGLDCHDPSKFIRRDDQDVFILIDELTELSRDAPRRTQEQLSTEYGFNVCPNGLLLDLSLRGLYKPVSHFLTDWMHTMVGDGVANSILGEGLHILADAGYSSQSVRDFMMQCTLPVKYGKARSEWLRDARIKLHTLTSFAGIVLTVVPILYLYMRFFCQGDDRVNAFFQCLELLHIVCGILATGADAPMKHLATLRVLIPRLHAAYVELGFRCKPKIHHMHHILDTMEWLGKCISCFVTERKHREVKDASIHVYRHMEQTVLADVVNKHCQQIISGKDLFSRIILVEPRRCKNQDQYLTARRAVLDCGTVQRGDVVFFNDKTCGLVQAFFVISEVEFVEFFPMPMVNGDPSLRDKTQTESCFKDCREVIDSCTWHHTEQPGIVAVCLPVILFFEF